VVTVPRPSLDGDIRLALAAIASELDVELDTLPISITGVLRNLSAAHYAAGVHDTVAKLTRARRPGESESPSSRNTDVTPVVGPHGRKQLSGLPNAVSRSKRPTPMVPPPRRAATTVLPPRPPDDDDSGDLN
jgi:hypothetical protein